MPELSGADGTTWAMRTGRDSAEDGALSAYLADRGVTQVARFAPKDDEDLDDALCAGRYRRVLFANWDALTEALCKGCGRLDRWQAAGVRIALAEPPTEDAAAAFPPLLEVQRGLDRWRAAQRHAKIVAAAILTAVALAVLSVLFCWVPSAP